MDREFAPAVEILIAAVLATLLVTVLFPVVLFLVLWVALFIVLLAGIDFLRRKLEEKGWF